MSYIITYKLKSSTYVRVDDLLPPPMRVFWAANINLFCGCGSSLAAYLTSLTNWKPAAAHRRLRWWVSLLALPPAVSSFSSCHDRWLSHSGEHLSMFFFICYTDLRIELHIKVGVFCLPLSLSRRPV